MPAPRFGYVGPRERIPALVAAAAVQAILVLVLLTGLRVPLSRTSAAVERLIDVQLPPPPVPPERLPAKPAAPAPKAAKPAASPGPPVHKVAAVAPVVALAAPVRPAGGGKGADASVGNGAGGGNGQGSGEGDDGGTDLVQIAGAILPSDYPRHLGNSGIGGRVSVILNVGIAGRVTRCAVTRSSGVPELDALTCRLMQQRFLFRPSTDERGHPVPDEVEWDYDWVAGPSH